MYMYEGKKKLKILTTALNVQSIRSFPKINMHLFLHIFTLKAFKHHDTLLYSVCIVCTLYRVHARDHYIFTHDLLFRFGKFIITHCSARENMKLVDVGVAC